MPRKTKAATPRPTSSPTGSPQTSGQRRPRRQPQRRPARARASLKAIPAQRPQPIEKLKATTTSAKLLENGWREIAHGLKQQIPKALQLAAQGKPALLRLIARFFRLKVETTIKAGRAKLILQIPRPPRELEKTPGSDVEIHYVDPKPHPLMTESFGDPTVAETAKEGEKKK